MAIRIAIIAYALWLIAPIGAALLLGCGVTGSDGTYSVKLAPSTCSANFSSVFRTRAGSENDDLLEALALSIEIYLPVALLTVIMAVPVAERLATVWNRFRPNASAAALATRVLPVTVAIPLFTTIANSLDLPAGRLALSSLYVVLFFPIACAILSAAPWNDVLMAEAILMLDARMSPWERFRLRIQGVWRDLMLAVGFLIMLGWSDALLPFYFLDPRSGQLTVARFLDRQQQFLRTNWGGLGAAVLLSIVPLLLVFALFLRLSPAGARNDQR